MIAENLERSDEKLRFLIVDDHPLFREALRFAVKAAYGNAEVSECASLSEALETIDSQPQFDLALLDLRIPDATGFDGLVKLRTMYPSLPIVIVSGHEDPEIVNNARTYGIAGYIPKSIRKDELTAAITSVINGNLFLPSNYPDHDRSQTEAKSGEADLASFTPQQLKVIGMIRDGLLNKQIAYELGVSETTVKAHVSKILKKLGVTNRTQAAMQIEKLISSDLIAEQEKFGAG